MCFMGLAMGFRAWRLTHHDDAEDNKPNLLPVAVIPLSFPLSLSLSVPLFLSSFYPPAFKVHPGTLRSTLDLSAPRPEAPDAASTEL